MTTTDFKIIQDYYHIGDTVCIRCSSGDKYGRIHSWSDSSILIMPFEGGNKPYIISWQDITSIEESKVGDETKVQERELEVEKSTPILPSKTTKILPQVIGHIDLSKIEDPNKTKREKAIHKKDGLLINNPFQKALSSIQPKSKCIDTYKGFIKPFEREEANLHPLKAVGIITKIIRDDHGNFGWIWDQFLEKEIWFSYYNLFLEDFPDKNNLEGTCVTYIKVDGEKGPKAIGICLPHMICELLGIVDYLRESKSTKQQAYDLLRNILVQYPYNEDAKNMEIDLKGAKKYPISSKSLPLNSEQIKKKIVETESVPASAIRLLSQNNTIKPNIILSEETIKSLPLNKTKMSEKESSEKEKELDALIRDGERERCLIESYNILSKKCPTPKYLRSYLDRMVNTEIALGNNSRAIKCLAQLISFNESQDDTKANTLSHLYISLARLLKNEGESNEALKALSCAELYRPDDTTIQIVRNQIIEPQPERENDSQLNNEFSDTDLKSIQLDEFSKMLQQDVEQNLQIIELDQIKDPERLYIIAMESSADNTKTFESRARLFLDSATAYLFSHKEKTDEYKLSVANYARMKGNAMYTRAQQSTFGYPLNVAELVSFADSARSYYIEALGIYNDLGQIRYLQELLLKYLKLERMISQIEGGRTPESDWSSGTLKAKLKECLNKENIEDQKNLYRTCIAIGAASERTWNTLASDKDGTGPMTSRFLDHSFRLKAFSLFNELEHSDIDQSLSPGKFLHFIFEHRQERISNFNKFLDNRLKWNFSQFDIKSFGDDWNGIQEYENLLSATDKKAMECINEVINILIPYASRNEVERTRFLVKAQQILLESQKNIGDTTTYYGRTFFFHLQDKWLKEISRQLAERDASTYPKLSIIPDPCYIKSLNGIRSINFLVSNNGESTADSFEVSIRINKKAGIIPFDKFLQAGDSVGLTWDLPTDINENVLTVNFEVKAKYQGRILDPFISEATYEIEPEIELDEKDIPWKLSNTPEEKIFKGREDDLKNLVKHYLSKDRYFSYILYGLTRTGKSSLLDYLCRKIRRKTLVENKQMIMMDFNWDLSKVSSYSKEKVSNFWANLIGTNIYNKLSEDLKDSIDDSYNKCPLPDSSELCQEDLEHVIDVLNKNHIMPFITIDEFSLIKPMLEKGLIDATFISTLRNLSLNGKACFVYAGTYDIKDLPKEEKYGIIGQMNNTKQLRVNEISETAANELIDAWDSLNFTDEAKRYIRILSGCVPYWIQWICLDCGKYAVKKKKTWLGYKEVDDVVRILTGESFPSSNTTGASMDEANFQNNQFTPGEVAEHQVITCIAFINREGSLIKRGVSIDELTRLWDKYNVPQEKRIKMVGAIQKLVERKILESFQDETRVAYRFYVDLFRRWWYVHHRDLNLEFSL